jgi:hypothetical protein
MRDRSPMSKRIDAVALFVAAQSDPNDETLAAFSPLVSDDVSTESPVGGVSGRDDLLASLSNPMSAPLATATWSAPIEDGDEVRLTATLAPGALIGGVDYTFAFDPDDRIRRVVLQFAPAPPPPVSDLVLTPAMADALAGSLMRGAPVVVAYVDPDGQAHLSYRGTTQVLSADQVAMWARDPNGGLVRNLSSNARLTLLYRDPRTREHYQFFGRGHLATDDATRDGVYEGSPEVERNLDRDRRGAAIVVDVDRVEGMAGGALVVMARAAGIA